MIIKLKRAQHFFYAFDEEGKAAIAEIPIGGIVEIEIGEVEKGKTATQRNALHVWLEQLAEVLNHAGLDMRKVLKEEVDIPWTKASVKEFLYKPVLAAMTSKKSTEDMNTAEPSEVCKVVGRHLADKKGITVPPWPTRFTKAEE